jgi:hypothetical protein
VTELIEQFQAKRDWAGGEMEKRTMTQLKTKRGMQIGAVTEHQIHRLIRVTKKRVKMTAVRLGGQCEDLELKALTNKDPGDYE